MKGYYLMYRRLLHTDKKKTTHRRSGRDLWTQWDEEQVQKANQSEEFQLLQVVAYKLKSQVALIYIHQTHQNFKYNF